MTAKLAIIGDATFGDMHVRAFSQMQRAGRAELVGLVAPDEKLDEYGSQYDVRCFGSHKEMFRRSAPDAVSIAGPDPARRAAHHRTRRQDADRLFVLPHGVA